MFEFIDVIYKNIINIPALHIEKGKITTLVGASGGGKTTVLRMLNKMISPTQGNILFEGVNLKNIPSVSHRRSVSMLSQNPAIFSGNIRDNLNAGIIFQGKTLPPDDALIHILEQVNLHKDLDDPTATLSGGEKQRLALGRILVLNPSIFLLDEPSSALDDETEDVLIQMLTGHVRKEKKTMIMVTHSKGVAQKYSDVILEVIKGKSLVKRFEHEWHN